MQYGGWFFLAGFAAGIVCSAKRSDQTITLTMSNTIKKSGTFHGKSNALGHGGRAAQMKAMGVPGGVIGMIARREQAAPGQKNYHPGHRGKSAKNKTPNEVYRKAKRK